MQQKSPLAEYKINFWIQQRQKRNSTDFDSSFRRMSIHIELCKLQWYYNIKPLTSCYNMGLVYFMKLYICNICQLQIQLEIYVSYHVNSYHHSASSACFVGPWISIGCAQILLLLFFRHYLNISPQCSVWVGLSKMCLTFTNHWTISIMITTSTNSNL